ncbi:PP2C family protein-serine/threonine phosphatase [Candidatus Promineifilum breve]|nr:protein phosphatase 2C domain-containing protein [Candidatus Promineifilum breve]
MSLSVAHAAHVGLERETNEDSYLVLVPPGVRPPVDGLLLVADGVGGTNAGEVASGVLVESFLAWFNGHTYGGAVHYNPAHADYFVAGLKDLLENANETLYQLAGTRSEWAKMGTTATVALFSNDRLFLGHVGDTRAYLLRDGALSQLTADHSWVAEEVAAGRMTPAEAQNHPRRNVISRVLGNGLLLRVDRQAIDLKPQDVVILTSDGLTGLVGDAEIQAAALGSRSLQEACDRLIATANSRGGHDNSTVLAARVLPEGQGRPVTPDGVVVNSVYLRREAAPNRAGAGRAERPGRGQTTVMPARPAGGKRGAGAGAKLLLFVAVAAAAGALGLAAAVVLGENRGLTLAGRSFDSVDLAGMLAGLAVIIGFALGYYGRQWLHERRQPGSPPQER